MNPAALLLCLLVVVASWGRAQAPGAVSGRVTCADSRTPCRFASVTLQSAPTKDGASVPPTPRSYAAATDLDGTFTMQAVAPGDYYITALLPGYLSPYDLAASEFQGDPALKPQAAEIVLTRLSVAAGQTSTANLLLSRGASLSGTVRYDDGGPAIQVPVKLFRKDATGAWQPYTNTAGTGDLARLGFGPKTDDRGRFYAPGLPPGTFTVQTSPPETAMLLSTITGTQRVDIKNIGGAALRVFYGDVYRLKQAKPLELHEGEERTDLSIDIPTHGTHNVQGVVTLKGDAHIPSSGTVRLLDADDKALLRETFIVEEGTFSFQNVLPGSYLLQVEARADTTHRYPTLTAPILVEGDLTGLTYTLTPAKRPAGN